MISLHNHLSVAVVVGFDDEESIMTLSERIDVDDQSLLDDDLSISSYGEHYVLLKGGYETENIIPKIPGSLKSLQDRRHRREVSEDDSIWSLDSLHLSTCRRCTHKVPHPAGWGSSILIDQNVEDGHGKDLDLDDEDEISRHQRLMMGSLLHDFGARCDRANETRSAKKNRDLPDACPTQPKSKAMKSSPVESRNNGDKAT